MLYSKKNNQQNITKHYLKNLISPIKNPFLIKNTFTFISHNILTINTTYLNFLNKSKN